MLFNPQLEQLKQTQEEIQGVHAKEKFEADHEITDLIKKLETHTEMNEKKEQLLMRSKGNHRERVSRHLHEVVMSDFKSILHLILSDFINILIFI